MPLQNSHVIHPRWQAHHEPVAEGTMTAVVQIIRVDLTGTRAPGATKTTYADPAVLWEGVARIEARPLRSSTPVNGGGQPITEGAYLVGVPLEAAAVSPRIRDIVKIVSVTGQPDMAGTQYDVKDIPRSSLTFEFDLGCDLQQPTSRGV